MAEPAESPVALLGRNASMLRLLGLYQQKHDGSKVKAALLSAFSLIFLLHHPVFAAMKLYMDPPEDLVEFALCSFSFIISDGVFIKTAIFIADRGMLHQMLEVLSESRRLYGREEANKRIRSRYEDLAERVLLYMQVSTMVASVGWLGAPLVSRALFAASGESGEVPRKLPLPVWLPVDVQASPTYEILYVLEVYTTTLTGLVTLCIDVLFIRLMLMVTAELEVLNYNVSTMAKGREKNSDDLYNHGHKQNMETQDFYRRDRALQMAETVYKHGSDFQLYQELVTNVRHHLIILRTVDLLEAAMSKSIIILLFINMGALCSNLLVVGVLLQAGGGVTRPLTLTAMIPFLLYQTGMFCVFGQLVTDQSEKLMISAFSCGWNESDARFRRSLLIFMAMVNRPLEITVGKTCKLSREMFLQVLNGSYTLFNMFYQVHSTS
ncbi:odorant receptor 43a-like [Schistocerca cancellata]|uniref:odorant receptor 43a-like n=2 Tax=Schistocerca TaxID=7008 RepID=UPI0021198E87|nr:odorant receptor 43a-like [Schistocerca cancellata]